MRRVFYCHKLLLGLVIENMLEKITKKIFFYCMVTTASLVLVFVWAGGPPSDVYAQIAASCFVVGLGSFLTWLVRMLYTLHQAFLEK
jgi:hypothetical protein